MTLAQDPRGRSSPGLPAMVTVAFLERGVLLSGVGCPQCQDAVAAAAAGLPNEAPETNDEDEDDGQSRCSDPARGRSGRRSIVPDRCISPLWASSVSSGSRRSSRPTPIP